MNEEQARIERVLQRLREAEPADGLERRVLRAVRRRTSGAGESRRSRWRLAFVRPMQGYAAAAAILALVLGSTIWAHRGPRAVRHDLAEHSHGTQPASFPETFPAVPLSAQPVSRPQPGSAASSSQGKFVRTKREQRAGASALGNHPAPEQPLTDEERLLLRIAHRGAPEQFSALNPDARDAQAKLDKAEFRNFFEPTPTGDSE